MKPPAEKAYRKLFILGSGSTVIIPTKRDWMPLLRRGLVEDAGWKVDRTKDLPPLRITPAGLRALADWIEREGWPSEPGREGNG